MSQILKQRVSVNAHECKHCQRDQRHSHDNDPNGGRHGDPHQHRIADQEDQGSSFHGVSRFHHAAEQLTGVGVVRRDHIDIAVFPFFHDSGLAALPPGDEHDVPDRDKGFDTGIVTDLQQVVGISFAEAGNEALIVLRDRLPGCEDVTIDQVDPVVMLVHKSHLPIR